MSDMNPIDFTYENRHYYIPFQVFPIIQLKGDTAAGKSLFVSDFKNNSIRDIRYKNHLIVTANWSYGLDMILNDKYDYVIIDNADVLITPELDEQIYNRIAISSKTKYVLIGRNMYSCVGSPLGKGSLIRTYNKEKSLYEFTVDFMHSF